MRKLILLSVLILAGCNPMDEGIRFSAKDTENLCAVGNGKLDNSSFQIGITKGPFWDTITITSTCVRNTNEG